MKDAGGRSGSTGSTLDMEADSSSWISFSIFAAFLRVKKPLGFDSVTTVAFSLALLGRESDMTKKVNHGKGGEKGECMKEWKGSQRRWVYINDFCMFGDGICGHPT